MMIMAISPHGRIWVLSLYNWITFYGIMAARNINGIRKVASIR